MTLPVSQYRTFRDLFSARLSVEGFPVNDASTLSFFNQLLADATGATSLSTARNLLASRIARRMLSGNASNPSDTDVVSFWTQYASDATASTAMGTTRQYRAMRNALRGEFSCDGLNPSDADVLGYFSSYAIAIPVTRFATGGIWDARDIAGVQGAAVAAPWTNPASAKTGTASGGGTAPVIWDRAVGGLRSVHLVSVAPYSYVAFDTLAPSFQGVPAPFLIVAKWHPMQGSQASLFCVMRGDGVSDTQLMFRYNGAQYSYTKKTVSGGTTSVNGPAVSDAVGDTCVAWRLALDGHLYLYTQTDLQGAYVKTDLGVFPVDALGATMNVAALGASRSSIAFEGHCGDVQKLAITFDPTFTDGDVQTFFTQLRNENYIAVPQKALWSTGGDSETLGSANDLWPSGVGPALAWRGPVAQFARDNGLGFGAFSSIDQHIGTGTGNNATSAASGTDIATIQAALLADIAAAPASSPIGWVSLFSGDGNNNNAEAPSSISTKWLAMARAVIAAGLAKNPNCIFTATTLPPISPIGGTQDLGINATNPLYQANFATVQSENPGKVYVWDSHSALGGVWTAQCFGADLGHPNHYGSVQEALDPQYGILNAKNELNEKFGVALRRLSLSASSPVAAACAIASPAPAASIPHGAITITGTASRLGGSVSVSLGSQSGPVTWTDYMAAVTASGGSSLTPSYQWSVTLTIPVGDVGARVVNATFTDIDGVTTAVAPSVNVTIT